MTADAGVESSPRGWVSSAQQDSQPAVFSDCIALPNRSPSSVQDELTEEEYEKQLKDVCMVLKAFEVSAEDVTALVDAEKKKPGTGAGGDNRGFDCVRIKLDVSAEGF